MLSVIKNLHNNRTLNFKPYCLCKKPEKRIKKRESVATLSREILDSDLINV